MNKFRITYPNNKEVREYKSRTTKTDGQQYGLNANGYYVRSDGKLVYGFYKNGSTSVNISPFVLNANDCIFTSVTGHELIHAYDYFWGFNMFFTEARAYSYSFRTQIKYGSYDLAYATLKAINYVAFPIDITNNPIPF